MLFFDIPHVIVRNSSLKSFLLIFSKYCLRCEVKWSNFPQWKRYQICWRMFRLWRLALGYHSPSLPSCIFPKIVDKKHEIFVNRCIHFFTNLGLIYFSKIVTLSNPRQYRISYKMNIEVRIDLQSSLDCFSKWQRRFFTQSNSTWRILHPLYDISEIWKFFLPTNEFQ